MSKNMIFAQKLIKLWACQTCQNKKTPCMFSWKIQTADIFWSAVKYVKYVIKFFIGIAGCTSAPTVLPPLLTSLSNPTALVINVDGADYPNVCGYSSWYKTIICLLYKPGVNITDLVNSTKNSYYQL
jgi:hypothetical protein